MANQKNKSITPFKTSKLFERNFEEPGGINLTVNQGGTSSGKTYSILQVLFIKAFLTPDTRITVCGQDIPNLKKGAIRDSKLIFGSSEFVQSIVNKYNISDRIYQFSNGSIIEFTSYDDAQDAKNGKRDYLFINEANGVPYEIFVELYQRTSRHTWIDYNPTGEFWLHEKQILQRPNVRFIKSTYKHNPFIDASIREKIEAYEPTEENRRNGTADSYLWNVYGCGEMGVLEGVLFPKNELNYYDTEAFDIDQAEIFNAYVDIADEGEDYHCCVMGANVGEKIFILDVVFNRSSVEDNSEQTAQLINKYKPEFVSIEINYGGTMYPIILRPKLVDTSIIPVRERSNKKTRIYAISSKIKKYCYFCKNHQERPQYAQFMKQLTEYKKDGSSKHDDAPDCLAGLVNYIVKSLNHLYNG